MRKLTLSLAVLAALLPGRAMTLGLGELELNSALNQELDAEIEVLSAAPEDAEQLIIKLADREAFARAGIDRPFSLQQLKFEVLLKDDKPYIRVYTKTPIQEPFLSFLMEVDWPEGHLLREYTMLLDPPVYSGGSGPASSGGGSRPFSEPAGGSAQPQSAAPQQQYSRPAESAYMAQPEASSDDALPVAPTYAQPAATSSDGQVSYRPMAQYNQVSGDYRVQQNDTLWSVANRFRPDASVSVEQMMLALVRENPEAFIKENIHGIKRGYILRMPDRSTMTSIDRQAAIAQVREHTALWREYRQAMTHEAPASAMEAPAGASADGMMEESSDGKLSIVAASGENGSDTAGSGQDPMATELKRLRAELTLANESLESERLEKENLQSRLDELEQRVQRVLEMDDSELAKLQQDLAGTREELAAPPAQEEVIDVPPESMFAEQQQAEEPAPDNMTETPVEESMPEDMAAGPEAAEPSEESVFVDENQPAEAMSEAEPMVEPAPQPAPVQQPILLPDFDQNKPKSFFEQLLDDPKMLGAVGGGLVAILALIALLLRRLRKGKSEEDEWVADESVAPASDTASFDEPPLSSEPLTTDDTQDIEATAKMAAAGEATPFDDSELEDTTSMPAKDDLEDTMVGLADEAPQQDEEKDDVLAEADVYLAYGIYQQAEELLNKAIRENPERDDYRMKLLETHFANKDAAAFTSLAEDVKQRKGDDRGYWDRVVVMGRELAPDNPLFSGEAVADLDTDDLLPQKPATTDLELDAGGDTDLDLGDLDMGGDDELDATQVLNEPLDLDALGESESAEPPVTSSDELDLEADLQNLASEMGGEEGGLEDSTEEDKGDLEFDLGEFDDSELEAATDTAATGEDLDLDEDFSLDFDASDLGFETEDEQAAVAASEAPAETALDLDADLDLGDLDDDSSVSVAEDSDLGDLDLDMGGLELDDRSAEASADDATADLDLGEDLDLGDSELNLDSVEEPVLDLDMDTDSGDEVALDLEEPALDTESSAMAAGDDDDFDISELSEDIDEVTTKLDLARAYIDMGDNEGARSILEEVQQEGNAEQQAQAAELLQQAS